MDRTKMNLKTMKAQSISVYLLRNVWTQFKYENQSQVEDAKTSNHYISKIALYSYKTLQKLYLSYANSCLETHRITHWDHAKTHFIKSNYCICQLPVKSNFLSYMKKNGLACSTSHLFLNQMSYKVQFFDHASACE